MSTAKFNDIDRGSKNDAINRNEIKFIDNKSDKKISTEIDKLNESLYKLNNFLKLTKDIDDMKKENSVKNDIQRKLSLKSQWLSSNHGSTASINSLPALDFKKTSLSSIDNNVSRPDNGFSSSTQSLSAPQTQPPKLSDRRNLFANAKSASVQNVNDSKRRYNVKHSSFDELNFMNNLTLSDQEIDQLYEQQDFQPSKSSQQNVTDDKLKSSIKKIELKDFIDKRKNIQAQVVAPRVSTNPSKRDLSKFFPKKSEKVNTANALRNPKELKDVDLSKYFIPSPVQELKSLPSPNQSPKLPRKPLATPSTSPNQNLLRDAISNLQKSPLNDAKNRPNLPIPRPNVLNETAQRKSLQKSDFAMHDQQLDGAVVLRKPLKAKLDLLHVDCKPNEHRLSAEIDEIALEGGRSPSGEYSKLFDGLKSPTENIDELFEEVAAKLVSKVPASETTTANDEKKRKTNDANVGKNKVIKKHKTKVPIAPARRKKIEEAENQTNLAPAPKWCRKSNIVEDEREALILSKLSSNLLNEIKLLEKQLEINENAGNAEPDVTTDRDDDLEDNAEQELDSAIEDILKSVESDHKAEQKSERPIQIPPRSRKTSLKNSNVVVTEFDNDHTNSSTSTIKPRSRKKSVAELTEKFNEIAAPQSQSQIVQNQTMKNSVEEEILLGKGMIDEFGNEKPRSRKNSVVELAHKFEEAAAAAAANHVSDSCLKISPETKANNWEVNDAYVPMLDEDKTDSITKRFSEPIIIANDYYHNVSVPKKNVEDHLKTNKNEENNTNLVETKRMPPTKPIRRNKSVTSYDTEHTRRNDFIAPSENTGLVLLANDDRKPPKYKPPTPPNLCDYSGYDIPPEELRRRHEYLTNTVSPHTNEMPPLNDIREMLKSDQNTNESAYSHRNYADYGANQEYLENSKKNPTEFLEKNPNYVYAVPGIYDNVPSTSFGVAQPKSIGNDSDYYSSSSSRLPSSSTNCDYDNIVECEPLKPLRRKSSQSKRKDATDLLIERSQMMHNKKQEFMDEKLMGNNPYLKRMLERESRENLSMSNADVGTTPTTSVPTLGENNRKHQNDKKKSNSLRSLNACVPSSPNHNVLDLFKRSPSTDKSSNKDGCVIS